MRSVTNYTGNEREEKARGTLNCTFLGTAIKTTTIFSYTADTLSQSITYRNDTGSLSAPGTTVRSSVTNDSSTEGEEKAIVTYNYNLLGTAIKTTTIFSYTADTLSKSITYM